MSLTHYVKGRYDGKGSSLKQCDIRYLDATNPAGDCNLVRYIVCVCSNNPTADRPKLVRMKFSDYVAAVDPNGVFADLVAELAANFPGADYRIIRPEIKKDLSGKEEHKICFELVPYSWILITSPGDLDGPICTVKCEPQIIHRSCKFGLFMGSGELEEWAGSKLGYDNTMSPNPSNPVPRPDDLVEWESCVEKVTVCVEKKEAATQNACPSQEALSIAGIVNKTPISIPGKNMIDLDVGAWRVFPKPVGNVENGRATLCVTYESAGTIGPFELYYNAPGAPLPAGAVVDPCGGILDCGPVDHPWLTPTTPVAGGGDA